MIHLLMQRHGKNKQLLGGAVFKHYSQNRDSKKAYWEHPEHNAHPEDQIRFVERMVKSELKTPEVLTVVTTHSLTIVYAFNNALLREPTLNLIAYEVIDPSMDLVQISDNRWIDESVLGHVADELVAEMNKLRTSNIIENALPASEGGLSPGELF